MTKEVSAYKIDTFAVI